MLIELPTNVILAITFIMCTAITITLFLVILLKNKKKNESKIWYFNLILQTLIVHFLASILWALAFFDIIPYQNVFLTISRIIYYTTSNIAGYLWLSYVLILIESPLALNRKKRLLYIPGAISVLAAILICIFLDSSQKTLPGYLTSFSLVLVPFSFVIFAGVEIVIARNKTNDKTMKRRLTGLSFWPIVVLVLVILQVLIPELPIFCLGIMIILVALYILLQENLIFTDPLTGINNRNMLEKVRKELIKDDKTYYIMMVDLDMFKSINDGFGHLEGDLALKKIANILKSKAGAHGFFVARYGGDEFIVIAETKDEKLIEDLVNEIYEDVKKEDEMVSYHFGTSIGYAKMNPHDNMDDIIAIADEKLYLEKEKHHQN